jgi:hypothetical protein
VASLATGEINSAISADWLMIGTDWRASVSRRVAGGGSEFRVADSEKLAYLLICAGPIQ